MKESPLFWPVKLKGNTLIVLDETLLPTRLRYIKVTTTKEAVEVIQEMKTRAFGQFLVVVNTFLLVLRRENQSASKLLLKRLGKTALALNASRPTFPFSEVTSIVMGWVQEAVVKNYDIRSFLEKNIKGFLIGIRMKRLQRIEQIADLIKDGDTVLTHCNVSGELAMAAYLCRQQNKKNYFFVTETRPYFQGAKLSCWEFKRMGIKVTLIADNAVGSLLMDRLVDLVIVGSDRSCANGDIANKIGTYQIAVLAKEFGVPFYVLTQPSKEIKKGEDIPIEIRNPNELLRFEGKRIVPNGTKGFYPAFDVVPNHLIKRSIAIDPSVS